jgi:lipopolysaccharide transport system ATP-binding protein
MSHNIAIQAEQLGKQYRIGVKEERHETLLHAGLALIKSPLTNYRQLRRLSQIENEEDGKDTVWALRDVSFTIEAGAAVGIIGRNGAGKSTLLKVLARITPPTQGRAILNGRVSSLLEVGTGFHPDLTGRENVYLNGTILGMSKAEVERKFDEIVAFAGVERFIDTPVKRYSSGMRVRLAFAVAAHLEAEILLVDEVLAVGDAAFQQKCLNKMGGVTDSGRTVLFVSHNMQVIQQLCQTAYLFDQGRLAASGTPANVIAQYLSKAEGRIVLEPLLLGEEIYLQGVTVSQGGEEAGEFVNNTQPFEVRVQYDVLRSVQDLLLGFNVVAADGTNLFRSYDMLTYGLGERRPGSYESIYSIPGGILQSGHYFFEVVIGIHRLRWLSRGEIRVRLNLDGSRRYDVNFPGVVAPIGSWQVIQNGGIKQSEHGRNR